LFLNEDTFIVNGYGLVFGGSMAVIGIGTDLIEISRIAESLERFGDAFVRRVLHPAEASSLPESAPRRAEYAAARFAAKEAVVKALGTGLADGIGMSDIEVYKDDAGKPYVRLHGAAQARAEALGARTVHISLTHAREYAAAFAVLEG
jgi:holo-[acyl-carrier protein] synthase